MVVCGSRGGGGLGYGRELGSSPKLGYWRPPLPLPSVLRPTVRVGSSSSQFETEYGRRPENAGARFSGVPNLLAPPRNSGWHQPRTPSTLRLLDIVRPSFGSSKA